MALYKNRHGAIVEIDEDDKHVCRTGLTRLDNQPQKEFVNQDIPLQSSIANTPVAAKVEIPDDGLTEEEREEVKKFEKDEEEKEQEVLVKPNSAGVSKETKPKSGKRK